jgi:RHS repeat-associated protein
MSDTCQKGLGGTRLRIVVGLCVWLASALVHGQTPADNFKKIQPALELLLSGETVEIYNVYADHLDTPRLITNQANQSVWQWDNNDPFGANLPNESPSALTAFEHNLRFPGQYFDKETNTHYNYFRDYEPATGRYAQSDPIGLAGGFNTYAYGGGNPLTQYDSLGLFTVMEVPPPGLNPYQLAQFSRMVATLNNLGVRFQGQINQACFVDRPMLQKLYDQWVVGVDPKVFNLVRNRSDFADTSSSAPTTTFYSQFFSQGDSFSTAQDPGQWFIFAHEFRHLFPSNRRLGNSNTTIKNRLLGRNIPDRAENDADAFARSFTTNCPCGVSQ